MTESEAIEKIRNLCSGKLLSFDVVTLEREPVDEEAANASVAYDATIAVIVKDGGFGESFVDDVMRFCTDSDWTFRFGGTRKEIHDLDFEVMTIRAMVSPQ